MLGMQVEKADDKTTSLKVSGELTVNNIAQLHKKISELLETENNLALKLENNTEIDMTFVQLICTAHRAYNLAGKNFCLCGVNNELFKRTDAMGFTRHKGCNLDKNNNCVLVKKEN